MTWAWNISSFAEAPLEIIDGDRGTNYPQHTDFADEGFCVFLNAGNVSKSGFDVSKIQFIDQAKDDQLRNGKLKRNDVVMTTRGTIGNVAHYALNTPFENLRINSGMVIFRCDPVELLPHYLYHFLRTPHFHEQTNSLRSGVAQPQLPIRDIRRIELPLPPLEVLMRIAEYISSYDELIENNRRRMALLEESARLLYREWFVRLRFLGHEHARLTHGLPEGWEKKRVDAIAEVNRATLPSGYDGEIQYVDIASVVPGEITERTTLAFQDAPSRARRIVQHGDIIWSCVRPNRRSQAVIWNPPDNLIVSTGFAVITPTGAPPTFLYFATTTDAFVGYLENHARGAAYPAVGAADFERAEILVPPTRLLELFDEVAEPTFSQMHNLRQQNEKLRAARDMLLPRLMTGQIEV